MDNSFYNVMLCGPSKIKSYGFVGLNLDDGDLGAALRISQDVYLTDIFGRDLIQHLQLLVFNKIQGSGDTIDSAENEHYKVLLDEYIVPCLAYRTAAELCTFNNFKIRNYGLVQNDDVNVKSAPKSSTSDMSEYFLTFFYDKVNRTMDFLCENKGAFAEIPDGFCTCSSKPRYARTGLWLGK